MNTDCPHTEVLVPVSTEDRALILAELNEILTSTPFRSSRRYPAMLRYIVEKTLANEQGDLKERTIGVEVFGRHSGYDTNADPVVRFSAGEVRKRIAQFYRENSINSTVEMELPLGTYVPRFYRRTALTDATTNAGTAVQEPESEPEPAPQQSSDLLPSSEATVRHATRWPYYLLAAICLATIVLAFTYAHNGSARPDSTMTVWAPLLKNNEPVLISAGRPHAQGEKAPEEPNITIKDHILRPEFRVTIPTLYAIANIAGYLRTQEKPFRIHEAYSSTLSDLHDRPVVLVTGNDNKWTKLLLQPFRFHFVQQGDFSYIEDMQRPGFRDWNVDFSKPFHQQTADYAIVARFTSATTGGPVIVVAGISSNGTEAAGEFIVSPRELAQLEKIAPPGGMTGNFEAVLKVEVVDGNTGSATVVASQFW